MAVQHIKVHQVHKAQSVKILRGIVQCVVHAVGVALVAHHLGNALPGKDIIDLADTNGSQSRRLDVIQQRFLRRLQRKIMPVAGAGVVGVFPHIRPRNDPSDPQLRPLQHFPRLFADMIKLLHRHIGLVGRDLEHTVRRGIADQPAGFLLLPAVVLYHLGPGIGLIAQHLTPGLFLKGLDKALRETIGEGRHRLGRNNSCQLPVSDGGILAAALFRHAAVGAHRGRHRGTAAHLINIKDAHFRQHRDIQLGGSGAGTQGIAARIAKVCAIRHFAAAAAIQHNEKNALFHSLYSLLPTPQGGVIFRENFPMLYCITFLA